MNIKFKSDSCSSCPFHVDIYPAKCKIDKKNRDIKLREEDDVYINGAEPYPEDSPKWCPLLKGAKVVVEWGEYGVEYDK